MNEFTRAKQGLQAIINPLTEMAEQYESKWVTSKLNQLKSSIDKEVFEIMVVGEFSNGKSTLINALLGDAILPASLNPTTTILNRIVYNDTPTYTLHYNEQKKQKITREEFSKLIAPNPNEFKNEEALKKHVEKTILPIHHAEIGYPTELCREEVVIIDSPGLNDNDELRETVTTNYIPKSDAAIFVINARKAMSQTEMDLVKRLYDKDVSKVFFILNFADMLNEKQREEVYEFVKSNLEKVIDSPKIYFTAARSALLHKRLENGEVLDRKLTRKLIPYEETGIEELKVELLQFLVNEKGLIKIQRATEGYQNVIAQFQEQTIQFEINELQSDSKKIEKEIEKIVKKINELPEQLKQSNENAKRTLNHKRSAIINWYKSELYTISKKAKDKMAEDIRSRIHPQTIKSNIENAIGSTESKTVEQLQMKIKKLMQEMISNQAKELNEEFDIIYNSNAYILPSYNSWDYEITLAKDRRNYGGFFRSIFEFFMPSAVDAVDEYTDRKSLERGYASLREQVDERFVHGIEKRVQIAERTIDEMFKNAQHVLVTEITERINDEKQKYERALQNSKKDKQVIANQLATMKADIRILQKISSDIVDIYKQYELKVGMNATI